MNKTIIVFVGIVVVISIAAAIYGFIRSQNDSSNVPTYGITNSPTPTPLVSPELTISPSPVVSKNIITYTDSGYAPNIITIKKGETVTWKNESGNSMWTASAVHPTHTVYPGTNIANCGTSAGSNQFDACGEVAPGQSWSFKFDNVGTWGYHNHRKAFDWGKVVVE